MELVTDWDHPAWHLPPTAARTGPFPRPSFLRAWASLRRTSVALAVGEDAALALHLDDDLVTLAGSPDVTDYHSPLGDGVERLAAEIAEKLRGRRFRFDSLPEEAARPLGAGLRAAGAAVDSEQHHVTAVVELPDAYEEWLRRIGKKYRHEVRRKRRRFVEEIGEPILVRRAGAAALDEFFRLHRRSRGEKGRFMTPDMEGFFRSLHDGGDAVVDLLVVDDRVVAATFSFEEADTFYVYNSAYDPDARHASPGIVMLSLLIEDRIGRGTRVFDLLKGDERYKFQHGAEPRPLYVLWGKL